MSASMETQAARRKIRSWYKTPDWRNPEDYPEDEASPDRWAWEFLRRNKSFWSEHEALLKECGKLLRAERGDIKHPWNVKWSEHQKRWGIKLFYLSAWIFEAPDDYDAPCKFSSGSPDVIHYAVKFKEDGPWCNVAEQKPDTLLIRFDLTKPIGPQVDAAAHYLNVNYRGDQKKLAHSKKKFASYLRAFDGYAMTGDYKLVADRFAEEAGPRDNADYDQNVPNWVARAEEYIQKEYLEIPMQFSTKYWQDSIKERERTSKSK